VEVFIHREFHEIAACTRVGWVGVAFQTLFLLPKSQSGQLTWINVPASFLSYCHHMKAARVLTLAERALVAEWIACAGDVGEAYVSDRRDEDPALRNRVVIVTRPEDGPTHVFHAPARRAADTELIIVDDGAAVICEIGITKRVIVRRSLAAVNDEKRSSIWGKVARYSIPSLPSMEIHHTFMHGLGHCASPPRRTSSDRNDLMNRTRH
jgi:hypothetical protein